MAKLFLFAIGGTGSRVLKALTMLLASGVRLENTDAVIPIVLDPHTTNDDLLRTRDLLREYANVRAALTTKPTDGFFSTEISTLSRSIGPNAKVADTYIFDLQGVGKTQFKDYINFGGLDPANKAFAGLLFSDSNLNTTMDIGFVGNPNIGSTVLNQFKNSPVFQAFAEHFAAGDRIFIVSSIFGGTGAAGFPILLKNIRGAQMASLANPAFLRDAAVGALTVGPYFSLSTGGTDTRIDGAAFIAKTKAALGYYEKNVNPAVNVMYAIADRQTRSYKYDPGDNGQPNDAHFVELASALAIVDFMATSAPNLTTVNGQPSDPILKEFGIADETLPIQLDRLAKETKQLINKPLAQMALFSTYLKQRLRQATGKEQWSNQAPAIGTAFLGSSFLSSVQKFDSGFRIWLLEMGRNNRAFTPFLLDAPNLAQTIIGMEPKKKTNWGFGKEVDVDISMINDFDKTLNKVADGKAYPAETDKFIQLFSDGTARLIEEKFPKVLDY